MLKFVLESDLESVQSDQFGQLRRLISVNWYIVNSKLQANVNNNIIADMYLSNVYNFGYRKRFILFRRESSRELCEMTFSIFVIQCQYNNFRRIFSSTFQVFSIFIANINTLLTKSQFLFSQSSLRNKLFSYGRYGNQPTIVVILISYLIHFQKP